MLHALTHYNTVLFSIQELACSHCGAGRLAPGFSTRLVELRVIFNEPMVLNSACRCKEYNSTPVIEGGVGGHPRSLHVFDFPEWPTEGCCAVDVRTYGKGRAYRDRLIAASRGLGWSIGFGKSFLHLDRRTDYTDLPRAEFGY
jgi:hypothetical protein